MAWLRNTELSPTDQQQLEALARFPKRGDADRVRALLLTYLRQTAEQICQALRVPMRKASGSGACASAREGVEGLKEKAHTGRKPVKREKALSVIPQMLENPNQSLTCSRIVKQIQAQIGLSLTTGYLRALIKKGGWAYRRPRHSLKDK